MPHEEAGRAIAVFDLDGTVTRADTLMPFVLSCLLARPWRLPRLLIIAPLALRFLIDRDRGRFKGGLLHATLGGLPRGEIEDLAGRFVPRILQRGLYAEALRAIEQHRARGDRLLLMSASVDLYVPLIGRALGFEQIICSQVRWRDDGRLDGRLASANCRGEEKRRCLQALMARERPRVLYAYGNSGADLPHLRLAQQGFLVNGPARLIGAAANIRALSWSERGGR